MEFLLTIIAIILLFICLILNEIRQHLKGIPEIIHRAIAKLKLDLIRHEIELIKDQVDAIKDDVGINKKND